MNLRKSALVALSLFTVCTAQADTSANLGFAGENFEAGFSTTVAEFDIGIAAIFANSALVGTSDESLVLSIGKSFDVK